MNGPFAGRRPLAPPRRPATARVHDEDLLPPEVRLQNQTKIGRHGKSYNFFFT